MKEYWEKFKHFILTNQKNKKTVYLAVIVVATITAISFLFNNNDQVVVDLGDQKATSEEDGSTSHIASETSSFYVDISGKIKNPGVYEVDPGTRLFQLIDKAGGLTKGANIDSINQAEEVTDGQKIVIPDSSSHGPLTKGEKDGLININSSSSAELQKINGIGPATAEKILDYRNANGPFTVIEDLKKVNGIGEKTFEKLKNSICV